MKLPEFLTEAKRATYAGNGAEKKLPDGSRELNYEKGQLKYRDRYFGSKLFSGQEIIFNKDKPVWSMNYYGKSIKEFIFTEGIYSFLRKALSKVAEDSPFRGPKKFAEGLWGYENKWEGNLDEFSGEEKIFYKDKLVYKLRYHGGEVK